eukprot:3881682-Pleurochrysis_carterae.AAC.2
MLQWLRVWVYMLAFPQAGERSQYWEEPAGGFGPRHRIAEHLALGKNGNTVKGRKWFDQMPACFALPTYAHSIVASDLFHPGRMFWDSLREPFHYRPSRAHGS